jgi:hypothetical protein
MEYALMEMQAFPARAHLDIPREIAAFRSKEQMIAPVIRALMAESVLTETLRFHAIAWAHRTQAPHAPQQIRAAMRAQVIHAKILVCVRMDRGMVVLHVHARLDSQARRAQRNKLGLMIAICLLTHAKMVAYVQTAIMHTIAHVTTLDFRDRIARVP